MPLWLPLALCAVSIGAGLIAGLRTAPSDVGSSLSRLVSLPARTMRTTALFVPPIVLIVAVVTAFTADPAEPTVTLPVEVIGPDGYTKSVTVEASDVSRVDSLYLRAYSIGYPSWEGYDVSKASVRINGGPWTDLTDAIATCKYPASALGCIDGPYHTLRFEVALADVGGTLVDGRNTIDFRFNYAFPADSPDDFGDPSTGYRILGLELRRPDDSDAIDGTSFAWDDPGSWTAPDGYADPDSVAEGKTLWHQRNLLTPRWDAYETITAACADCHADDGRDLAYFAFSNWSIIARSEFHGLSESQGKKIAAYIRSLELRDPDDGHTYEPPGRPWHPPYQPGPTSVASRSEEAPRTAGTSIRSLPSNGSQYWAAGAGVQWALDRDQETARYLFPGGPSRDDVDPGPDGSEGVDPVQVPVQLQFPDWNEWLPVHHPLDMWGDDFKTGVPYGDDRVANPYEAYYSDTPSNTWGARSELLECRANNGGDPTGCDTRRYMKRIFKDTKEWWKDHSEGWLQSDYQNVNHQDNPAYRRVNLNRWASVKSWEVMHSFDAADDRDGNARDLLQWPAGRVVFDNAPHITGGYAGDSDGRHDLWLDNAWYELNTRINHGRGITIGHGANDWRYQHMHLGDYRWLDQPYRLLTSYAIMLRTCQTDVSVGTPGTPRGWLQRPGHCDFGSAIWGHGNGQNVARIPNRNAAFEALFGAQVERMMYQFPQSDWERTTGRDGWEPADVRPSLRTDWFDVKNTPSHYLKTLDILDSWGVRPTLLDSAAVWLDGMNPSSRWDAYRWYPQSMSIRVHRSFGGTSDSADYHLVALPGRVDRPVEKTLSGKAGTDWQAYWDDGSPQNYLRPFDESAPFRFRPGRGFWLTSTDDWTVHETVPTVDLEGDTVATIDLHDGWNVIANPLDESVSWGAVEHATGASLEPLWRFEGAFVQADTFASATTGKAYYVLNAGGLDSLSIPYPYPETPVTKRKTRAGTSASLLALSARPGGQSAPSSTVRIGITGDAKADFDSLDIAAPPKRFSTVSLRLDAKGDAPARQRLLAEEQRPPGGEGHTFDLRLWTRTSGSVRLRAQNLDAVDDREVVLLRSSTGRRHDFRRDSVVVLQNPDGARLRLAVGSKDYVANVPLGPSFTRVLPDTSVVAVGGKNERPLRFTYAAEDQDSGEHLEPGGSPYSLYQPPAHAQIDSTGELRFRPSFAQGNRTFTIAAVAADADGKTDTTRTDVAVHFDRRLGDVDGSGYPTRDGSGIRALDAFKALQVALEKSTFDDGGPITKRHVRAADCSPLAQQNPAQCGGDSPRKALWDDVSAMDAFAVLRVAVSNGEGSKTLVHSASPKNEGGMLTVGRATVNGKVATVPIRLSEEASGVHALDLSLDLKDVSVVSLRPQLPEKWTSAHRLGTDNLQFGTFGPSSLPPGPLVEIRLKLGEKELSTLEGTYSLNGGAKHPLIVEAPPEQFALEPIAPNPTSRRATIEYALPRETDVTIDVYDVLGRRVQVLTEGTKAPGTYHASFEADRLPSGVYFVRMRTDSFAKTRRVTVVR